MSDQINRAAQVIYNELSGKYGDFNMPTGAAEALDAAGLLATRQDVIFSLTPDEREVVAQTYAMIPASPEHDAAVAAKALRDFAGGTRFPNNWILFRRDDGSGVTVSDLLRETADGYIERARGTSDADA